MTLNDPSSCVLQEPGGKSDSSHTNYKGNSETSESVYNDNQHKNNKEDIIHSECSSNPRTLYEQPSCDFQESKSNSKGSHINNKSRIVHESSPEDIPSHSYDKHIFHSDHNATDEPRTFGRVMTMNLPYGCHH